MLTHFKNLILIRLLSLSIHVMLRRVFPNMINSRSTLRLPMTSPLIMRIIFRESWDSLISEEQMEILVASGRGAATDLIPTLNASAEPVSVSGVQ